MKYRWPLALLMLITAPRVLAGELHLTNGAVLPGEIERVEADRIVWKADLIGTVSVEKSAVARLVSQRQLALSTPGGERLSGCLLGVDAGGTALRCAEGERQALPLAGIRPDPLRERSGKANLAVKVERNTSDTDEIEADLRVRGRDGRLRRTLEASVDYEEKNQSTSSDEADLAGQADWLLRDDWYVFGRAEYHRDRKSSIQESTTAGAGLGRDFRLSPDLLLKVEGGLGETEFTMDEKGDFVTEIGLVHWEGTWKTPWWRSELFHEGEYIWVLEDTNVNRLQSRTGIAIPLVSGLVTELRLDYDRYGVRYDGMKTDVEWVWSLGYRW